MKKLLNPLVVSAFIFVLVLGSIAHLMYGSCQTTKYHYIIQNYYMQEYFPQKLIFVKFSTPFAGHGDSTIEVSKNYNGLWYHWQKNGFLRSKMNYLKGQLHGKTETWGEKKDAYGVETFMNGNKTSLKIYVEGKLVMEEYWNDDGSRK
ncbi:MAG: hypothetical protein COA79_22205 [Planctomycetota bacterium]|nr:MAG: hypothetical protein COA79_22205 [Planctomycetota bacterium]